MVFAIRPKRQTQHLKTLRVRSGITQVFPKHSLVDVASLRKDTSLPGQLRGYGSQLIGVVFRWLHKLMDRLPGQCTVSKLDAFDLFQSNTSPYAVIAILLLTPLPCLIINLLIECIPLNRPSAGFWASGCFQLRLFWAGFFSSLMPSLKKVDCVPGSPGGSPRELLLFAASQACIGVITNAIISVAADVFPVPFSQFTPIIPMTIVGRLLFYRHLPEDPQFHAQSNKVNLWVSVEVLPVLIYPAFTVAFMALTSTQQFWVSFLLPLVKVAIRRVLWWITRDDHDLIGVMTSCVGHLYHVLFIAMVLQNSKSLDTIGVVVLAGVMKMLLNCYYILADSKDLFAATIKLDCAIQQREDYCSAALRIAQDACVANELNNSVPSLLLSTYPRYRRLEFLTRYEGVLKPVTSVQDKRLKLASVVPWSALPQRASHGTVYLVMAMSRLRKNQTKKLPRAWVPTPSEGATSRRKAYVNKFAYAMHQSQIVLLKSYVTICMTSFYVIYLIVVFWLPNHQYFATQAAMTTFDAVGRSISRLLLLCGMEIIFLSIYGILIGRHLGVSGVHQLAFVLWSQRIFLQAQFIQLTVTILAFPLTHFGNDSLLPLQLADKH